MFIDIHTHQQSETEYPQLRSYNLSEVSELKPFCSVGVYPFDIPTIDFYDTLARIASHDLVAAIGETGLDKRLAFRGSIEFQKEVFRTHIEIANNVSKPLIIHQVRAIEDTIKILSSAKVPVIFHGFTGSVETATQITKQGYYLSFGHELLTNERLQYVFKQVTTTKIFLETDSSAIDIRAIYDKAAELKYKSLENIIETNFYDTGLASTYRTIARRRKIE